MVNPLMLALPMTSTMRATSYEGPGPLVMLSDVKCDPNILGVTQQSPRLFAVGLQNHDAIENFLIVRADFNYSSGLEPPLCGSLNLADIHGRRCSWRSPTFWLGGR